MHSFRPLRLLGSFILLLLHPVFLHAQIVWQENFDGATLSTTSSGMPGWNLNNRVGASPLFSDSTSVVLNDSSVLLSPVFSTVGMQTVRLSLKHFITGEIVVARIMVSNDGGITWSRLGSSNVIGSFPLIAGDVMTGYSDPHWDGMTFCNTAYSNRFVQHSFDISALCSNASQVQVKFVLANDNNANCGSWMVDDVRVEAFPYVLSFTPACNADGTATMTANFGTGTYSYSWNSVPAQFTQTATGLSQGVYTCTVTDGLGVSFTDSIEVKSVITANVQINPPHCGLFDGSLIAIGVSGGTAPYTYLWNAGVTTPFLGNVGAGIYTLVIVDANGCTFTTTIDLTCSFSASNLSINTTPAACDSATGTATVVSFLGGIPPFTYLWNTIPAQTTQTATGLAGDTTYILTVTDSTGESVSTYVNVPFINSFTASISYVPTFCNDSSGIATVSVNGGVPPYSYLWNTIPAQNTVSAINLPVGTYLCMVEDSNGCRDSAQVYLSNVSSMSATVVSTNTQCNSSTGTATISVNGGTPPYSYLWTTSPAQTTAIATGLSYGMYSVMVTDSLGCTLTKNAFVGSTSPIQVTLTYASNGCNCVNVTATASNGAGGYTYLWNDGQTSATAICMDEGYHYVYVTDANGCYAVGSVQVVYPGNCFINVQGYVYRDVNSDCNYNVADYPLANVNMVISGLQTYSGRTDATGYYHFTVPAGVYQLSQIVPANFVETCQSSPININVPAGTTVNQNFGDSALTIFDEAVIDYCSPAANTVGFAADNYISVRNNGTSVLSGTLTAKHDVNRTYLSSTPIAIYNFPARTITWNYGNLKPGESRNFRWRGIVPVGTPLGTAMYDSVEITPLITDINTYNNYCHSITTVVGSFDPNDKVANPIAEVHRDSLWHYYRINFQNTGNAPAVRIVVEDTLDATLDGSSIIGVTSSHIMLVDNSELPLLRFVFDDINLPDSMNNEPASHGFVSFYVKHQPGLPSGTQINNTAYIYFDFNAAVVTNTVTNTITLLSVPETDRISALHLVPNPSQSHVDVWWPAQLPEDAELVIADQTGRILKRQFVNQGATGAGLDVQSLSDGIYLVNILSGLHVAGSGKLVILR